MMDLHPIRYEGAVDFIREQIEKHIFPEFGGGFILESRKSYQFLGTELMPHERFGEFMGEFLIAEKVTKIPGQPNVHTPIADVRNIGHSLKRGSTGLRLTARGNKSGVMPQVVALVG